MLGLGNVANTLSGGHALNPRQSVVSESAKSTSPTAVPDDEAAVAVIRNPLGAQEVRQDGRDENAQHPLRQTIEETAEAIREKLDEFKELVEGITIGGFSARNLSQNLEAEAEQIRGGETSIGRVYSGVSELLSRFRDEVNEIRSFDGFLLGVHEKIEQFRHPAQFELNQVRDVAEHMADVNADMELGIFTLARVREKALKAMRCQEAPEPQRVLKLLEDDVNKPNAAEPATPEETPSHVQNVLL
ncbi:MAG TPA: hypothetical protein VMW24_18490 [Sedimentisphaerales bacterium]|jgi:hypothetical protein|nr:hypothetical protein [Sedimentisphaerales bacterium]